MPPDVERARNLRQRVVSAFVVTPPALAALWTGGPVLAAFLAVVALVLAWEWDRLCSGGQFGAPGVILAVGLLGVIAACSDQAWVLAVLLAIATAVAVFAVKRMLHRPTGLWTGFGALYIGVPLVALLWLRSDPETGRLTVLWVVAVTVATDIGGYVAGRILGGPKLAPAISPNKTWAGAAGAGVASVAVGCALVYGGRGDGTVIPASVVLSVAAQGGDLFESSAKRRFGAKDSSHLIPGHGGLFDRVDGHLAAFAFAGAVLWISGGSGFLW